LASPSGFYQINGKVNGPCYTCQNIISWDSIRPANQQYITPADPGPAAEAVPAKKRSPRKSRDLSHLEVRETVLVKPPAPPSLGLGATHRLVAHVIEATYGRRRNSSADAKCTANRPLPATVSEENPARPPQEEGREEDTGRRVLLEAFEEDLTQAPRVQLASTHVSEVQRISRFCSST
ncbi:MAG: hypothetical protein WCP35_19305, partial [Verrucomicrobiota bacterium]